MTDELSFDEQSVEELRDQLKDAVAEERSDAAQYAQRAGAILGFSAVVIGLVATQARELLLNVNELSSAERWIAVIALGSGIVFVAAAALMALWALGPQKAVQVSTDELKSYETRERLREPRVQHQGRALRALAQTISLERDANAVRTRWVARAFRALLVGVVCLAIHISVFLVDASNGAECSQRPQSGGDPVALIAAAPSGSVGSATWPSQATAILAKAGTATTPEERQKSDSPFPCPPMTTVPRP